MLFLGMGRYRYQILDTIDTTVLKIKSIDTGKKYHCFDTSEPAIVFHYSQRAHENEPKNLNRRKYYKSSSFLWCYKGLRAGSEFLVTLAAITDIYYLNVYIALVPLFMIKNSLSVVMVVRVGKISISKKIGKYRGNIVSNGKAGTAHPH